ncbi:MAG: glycosyltransferase [Gallionellales bacterium 35-53-114]|jgi:glycosyltransferase involved in cell wall biosynthesis|nr:MAG: glycosyltransferase [Gallionellales bacterium 35-53-114]OYZ63426.1 MAG: glycosyltransferase [Gallionellales bacterium 24-53-125]OZB10961.1 MAG: glycosyltransferase [Gallionellales bacterium 39-52-133]HQS58855.1 glycosyltransferase [Gallionellaceae bacterium]HQS75760.1 glycosyltransferase [Gallionellaceae bacterium]
MSSVVNPLISVVIPTYNHAHYLGRCLQSVLDQTYENWEAIVIDNHSTDNTDEVVRNFAEPRIKLLKIHNDGVIAASRNMGIRAARGEWVAFLDSDDWWRHNKLQVCIDISNSQIDLLYHDLKIVREIPVRFQPRCIKSRQVKKPVIIDLLVNGNAIATSSALVRKKLLDQIGGMDERKNLVAAEDYNCWLRISQITDNFKYIPEELGCYLLQRGGMSRKDMSVSMQHATDSFSHLLNHKQRKKYFAVLKYSKGRFAYLTKDYGKSKNNLLFSARYGSFLTQLKSLWMLMVMWSLK